jgi:two-component sensor histidine kinase
MIREDGTEFPYSEHPYMHTLATGEACKNIVMGITSASGSFFWVNINATPLFRGEDAKPYAVVISLLDITERKKAEETIQQALAEKEVLLREIHHRVKNNLAGILALIELQISSLTDPVAITQFKDLETRIRSMALVHESLCSAKDLARINFASYTENLTRHLFQVYRMGADVKCKIEMEDIILPIETATPCGLVMSEIVTNSLKYAFPKTFSCEEIRREPCTITLTLHREGSDYLLGIADNGIGMPEGIDATMSHSLGLFLIRFIVEHQLRGSIEINTLGGTAYTIRFPEPAVKERNTDEKM